MLNTFEALVPETEDVDGQELEQNPAVDLAAIVNRLNDLEMKVNELLNKATEPTEETGENGEAEPTEETGENGEAEPSETNEESEGNK